MVMVTEFGRTDVETDVDIMVHVHVYVKLKVQHGEYTSSCTASRTTGCGTEDRTACCTVDLPEHD